MAHKSGIFFVLLGLSAFLFPSCYRSVNSARGLAPLMGTEAHAETVSTDSVLKKPQSWVLVKFVENGEEVKLPADQDFAIKLNQQKPDADRACTDGCGYTYSVMGRGLCGPLSGEFDRRFDETQGSMLSQFNNLESVPSRGCSKMSEDSRILSALREQNLALTYDEGQELLYLRGPRQVMVFEAQEVSVDPSASEVLSSLE